MGIVLDVDMHEVNAAKKALKGIAYGYARAQKMAIRRALESMRTEAVRKAQEVYYVKAKAVRRAIYIKPAAKNTGGQFIVKGKRLSLSEFYMTPTKRPKRPKGLRVAVKHEGGIKSIPKGFLIPGRNSGKMLPFVRTGRERDAIKHMMSPAVPQMIENYEVSESILTAGEEAFMRAFHYWAGRAVSDHARITGNEPSYIRHIPIPYYGPTAKSGHHQDITGWH